MNEQVEVETTLSLPAPRAAERVELPPPTERHVSTERHLTPEQPRRRGRYTIPLAAAVLLLLVLGRDSLGVLASSAGVQTWVTVTISIVVSATPFLALGVLLSAAVSVLLPSDLLARALPKQPSLRVCAAGGAGVLLPGCECAAVPLARSLMGRGVAPAAALAFLLAAPAVNPVVLVATAVAFPAAPEMVAARLLAGLATAIGVGLVWLRLGRDQWLRLPESSSETGTKKRRFLATMEHDLLHAGGFLVVGGMLAATAHVLLPTGLVEAASANPVLAVLALATLAFLVAICSEADAFVAASLTMFPRTAQLAFMVVGPAVDVKLVALQAGTFGRRFAVRFAPLTFVVAVTMASVVGTVLL